MPMYQVRVLGLDGEWSTRELDAPDDGVAAWVCAELQDPECESYFTVAEVGAWSEQHGRFLPPRRVVVLPDGRAVDVR
jgi:hypothetical protein